MSDDDDDDDGLPGLPKGTPFYMTPAGHAALRAELEELWSVERPKVVEVVSWAASLGDRSENADYQYGKRRLRQIDGRVRFLRKRLERAQVAEVTITIVGMDEADAERGLISWVAPVARTLLGKRVGDIAKLRTPQGVEDIEIVSISYPEAKA